MVCFKEDDRFTLSLVAVLSFDFPFVFHLLMYPMANQAGSWFPVENDQHKVCYR